MASEFCHTGFEALCAALAQLAFDDAHQQMKRDYAQAGFPDGPGLRTQNMMRNALKLSFARQLYNNADRFEGKPDKDCRTWKLVESTRKTLFQSGWSQSGTAGAEEVDAGAQRAADAFMNIIGSQGPAWPDEIYQAMKACLAALCLDCEDDVSFGASEPYWHPDGSFVQMMLQGDTKDSKLLKFYVSNLARIHVRSVADADWRTCLEEVFIPALESGFRTDRFTDFQISAFSNNLRVLVDCKTRQLETENGIMRLELAVDAEGAGEGSLDASLQKRTYTCNVVFLSMIAACIYGPQSRYALFSGEMGTEDAQADDAGSSLVAFASCDKMNLSVFYDSEESLQGQHGTFDGDTVVYIGREERIEPYRKAARRILKAAGVTGARREEVFNLPKNLHKRVSHEHAMLVYHSSRDRSDIMVLGDDGLTPEPLAKDEGSWWIYDLGSKNGTRVLAQGWDPKGGDVPAGTGKRIEPGDRVVLGYGSADDDYLDIAYLALSFPLDVSSIYQVLGLRGERR